jgi:hypothetical protein
LDLKIVVLFNAWRLMAWKIMSIFYQIDSGAAQPILGFFDVHREKNKHGFHFGQEK